MGGPEACTKNKHQTMDLQCQSLIRHGQPTLGQFSSLGVRAGQYDAQTTATATVIWKDSEWGQLEMACPTIHL